MSIDNNMRLIDNVFPIYFRFNKPSYILNGHGISVAIVMSIWIHFSKIKMPIKNKLVWKYGGQASLANADA